MLCGTLFNNSARRVAVTVTISIPAGLVEGLSPEAVCAAAGTDKKTKAANTDPIVIRSPADLIYIAIPPGGLMLANCHEFVNDAGGRRWGLWWANRPLEG